MHSPAWLAAARAVADLPPETFAARYAALTDPEDQREALRMRFRYDRAGFLKFCFPDVFYLPWNPYHLWALSQPKVGWQDGWTPEQGIARPTVRRAIAAPRGIAKTTLSKGDLVHDIVYGLEGYILILSAGMGLSRGIAKHVRAMFLRKGSPLDELYGPFTVVGGVDAFTVQVQEREPIGVLAKSFATEIRGANDEAVRPTKVVVDDGEKKREVNNPEQRQKWWDYLHEDILKVGPKEGGLVTDWRGTVLHPESVLAQLLEAPGWESRRWQSIISWPERTDLWEQCSRIWGNLRLGDAREKAARAFYEANRAEMDRGAEVLDPVAEPLFALYQTIWSEGLASFLKEKQNEPVDPTRAIFHEFQRCRVERDPKSGEIVVIASDGMRRRRSELRFAARWDPAMGTPDGDYAAIAVVARDSVDNGEQGYGYVVDAWLRKGKPSEQAEAAWMLAEKWGLSRIQLESNGFQSLVAEGWGRARRSRREAGQWWQTVIDEVPTTTDKKGRIASLEPHVKLGWLQFAEHLPAEVFQQFRQFPSADHDDAPDAIHAAWVTLGGVLPSMSQDRIR